MSASLSGRFSPRGELNPIPLACVAWWTPQRPYENGDEEQNVVALKGIVNPVVAIRYIKQPWSHNNSVQFSICL
jgi:hypothetical protein